jgi:hypothetical protein
MYLCSLDIEENKCFSFLKVVPSVIVQPTLSPSAPQGTLPAQSFAVSTLVNTVNKSSTYHLIYFTVEAASCDHFNLITDNINQIITIIK